MEVHHTLICFFLMLQDVKTGLINAETRIYTGTEGGNIKVSCSFLFHGNTKIFCKDKCEKKEDILLETTSDRAERGRYRIEYERGAFTERATLYVSITQLNMSDSGRYWCGLERFGPYGHDEFEIRVIEASTTSKPNLTLRPSSTSLPPSSTPSAATNQPETSPAGFFLVLVVCIPVLMVVVPLAVVLLLLLYKKKMKDSCGLKTRGNSDHSNTECVTYENCPPPSTCEDSTYQSLNPASRDHDQTYSTLTYT
ncbi:CMRF35-like molecule 5 [Seriola dumerili]|uniref:CMRF35-like molecule 5 n=1 Tax=Seriola dumerili TaxID=41447 RepID=UPI000BBF33D3|nr:CMRF35-like molecule 5 [Seriola dumerili]XP_022619150.1 CMRF35-like molecule 5 [Seriola dumerili]